MQDLHPGAIHVIAGTDTIVHSGKPSPFFEAPNLHKTATRFRSCFTHYIRVFARSSSASLLLINRAPSPPKLQSGIFWTNWKRHSLFDGKWMINLPRTKQCIGEISAPISDFFDSTHKEALGRQYYVAHSVRTLFPMWIPKQEMHNYLIKVSADHLLPARRSMY